MTRLLLKHLALGLIVVFAAISLTFALVRLSGDPTSMILPQEATAEQHADLRSSLGLDRPILEQYISYVAGAVRGDFGASYFDSSSVSSIVLAVFAEHGAFGCCILHHDPGAGYSSRALWQPSGGAD